MTLEVARLTDAQAAKIIGTEEGQFSDVKAIEIEPGKLTKFISALANADGGDLYVGIEEVGPKKLRNWRGFANPEAANAHLQVFERLFPLGTDFNYEFLRCDSKPGLVLHVQINKTQAIVEASNKLPYVRRGAQSLPVDTPDALTRLQYAKGVITFENEIVNAPKETIIASNVTENVIKNVVPSAAPEAWLKKQVLLRNDHPTVAGALLFADEPQALLPKRCGIKVYYYKTNETEGFREALAFDPKTVEGSLYDQIKSAVALTTEIVESIPKMGDASLEAVKYPNETLHEIITNAALHRDYSVADDVHIRIFNNRIEVQSPGKLPAHVTVANILDERFARNGSVVRILNKFPNPPNKDVGEGLNTAFEAMNQSGFKAPTIIEKDNSVLVLIKHVRLASAEEAIMDYLEDHETIKNREARKITHVRADYQIKAVFNRMVKAKMIEQVPGTRTSNTAYRKVREEAMQTGHAKKTS